MDHTGPRFDTSDGGNGDVFSDFDRSGTDRGARQSDPGAGKHLGDGRRRCAALATQAQGMRPLEWTVSRRHAVVDASPVGDG